MLPQKVYIIPSADDTTGYSQVRVRLSTLPDRSGMALHTISLGCQNEGLITRMGLRKRERGRETRVTATNRLHSRPPHGVLETSLG